MIRNYLPSDFPAILNLWNSAGTAQGYAPQTEASFAALLTGNLFFSPDYAFVLTKRRVCRGFICGCSNVRLPQGDKRGYFTCLLLPDDPHGEEKAETLLAALEAAFRRAGKTQVAANYFNPMRMPWLIPGTPGHQHNNCPGIAEDLPLYRWMQAAGYRTYARECAMYRSLSDFQTPDWVTERMREAACKGYTVDWYRKEKHHGLTEMVYSLGNPMWNAEIPEAAEKINMLVALHENQVVGFAGPVYPEPTGRGYFAGIAVAPQHEHQGLGTLLFYRLCQAEKEAGSQYMSLFTGTDNRAQKIYLGAGFQVRRTFSLVTKEL